MSRFRRWLRENISRLDGHRERKAVAKFAAFALFLLIIGPAIVTRAATLVDSITDTMTLTTTLAPTLTMVEIGATPVPNPVTIKAFITDGILSSLAFEITSSGGFNVTRSASQNAANPSEWLIADFVGDPGRTYEARARGQLLDLGAGIDSLNQIVFTIQSSSSETVTEPAPPSSTDATPGSSETSSTTSGGTTAPSSIITLEKPTLPDPQKPAVRLRADVSGSSLIFVKFAVTFPDSTVKNYQATLVSTTQWETMVELPTGAVYAIRAFGITSTGQEIASENIESIEVPAAAPAETTVEPTTEELPPLAVEFLSPPEGTTFFGSVPLIARVLNAQATSLVFEIAGESGGKIPVTAAPGAISQDWLATFEGQPGEYRLEVSVMIDGVAIRPDVRRTFKIAQSITAETPLPSAEPTEPPPAPPATLPPPLPAVEPVAEEPKKTEEPFREPEEIRAKAEEEEGAEGLEPAEASAPVETAAAPEETTADECAESGIPPERCASWLAAKYQRHDCFRAGILTRESCVEYLSEKGETAEEKSLTGLITAVELEKVREEVRPLVGTTVEARTISPETRPYMAVVPEEEAKMLMLPAALPKKPGQGSSPALMIFDNDGDGLPDDVERRLGTDPVNPDSDNDGFTDGVEVKNGYNPLGAGVPERVPVGVDRAIVRNLPIEEPRGREDVVDSNFSVAAVESAVPPEAPPEAPPVLRLSGRAAPNTVVTVFIYTYLPIVVTTTTDENGNWTYDFHSKMAEGRHEAYVSVNDDTGKIVAASNPLAFFIKTARAASEEEFLRPDVNVEERPAVQTRYFLIGGLALILLALVLTLLIIRQIRKSPASELPPESHA